MSHHGPSKPTGTTGPLWAVGVALLAAAVALGLPTPTPAPSSRGVSGAATPAPTSGATRLADAWPSARIFTFDGMLADGESFYPAVILDENNIVGLARNADNSAIRLVVRHSAGAPRVLRVLPSSEQWAVATVLVSGMDVYWSETGENDGGEPVTAVWRAGLNTGTPRRLSLATSALMYFGSHYDLQLVAGRLYWTAYAAQGRSELRSVSIEGGALTVRPFDRVYGMTAYPWITTSVLTTDPGDVDMVNLLTEQHVAVAGSADQILSCTPTWCRVTKPQDAGKASPVILERRDGTQKVSLAPGLVPVNTDVALLDRFEVAESVVNSGSVNATQRIWLYDLENGRQVLLGETATGFAESNGGFLWWSTGDNEATVFHVLDLRQLV